MLSTRLLRKGFAFQVHTYRGTRWPHSQLYSTTLNGSKKALYCGRLHLNLGSKLLAPYTAMTNVTLSSFGRGALLQDAAHEIRGLLLKENWVASIVP